MFRSVVAVTLVMSASASWPMAAHAQSLGAFRWQTQPYCNVLTLSVIQEAGLYRLEGFDDQCGAATKAPVSGTAVPNADGTIQLGLSVVSSPGGAATHIAVPLSVATLGGPWKDAAGNTGTFAFNGNSGGSPRPVPAAVPLSIDLRADSGIVARGKEIATGPQPLSKSTRMLWDAGRGAFRAGGIAYGNEDDAIGLFSVGLGFGVKASGVASVALGTAWAVGDSSVAVGGAYAEGKHSVAIGRFASALRDESMALGVESTADAVNAVAIGAQAKSLHAGAIVLSDGGSRLDSTANNQFTLRAKGGARIFSNFNQSTGVQLAPNASAWSSLSDVNSKEHFRELDSGDLLAKLAKMSIREWSYKAQDASIRHVGPTAQDFHAAFGLGEDPLRISTIDADGIALAGVSALAGENAALKAQLAAQQNQLAAQRAQLAVMQARLDQLEAARR